MSVPHLPPLHADGKNVWVHTVTPADLAPYQRAVEMSAERIAQWNPVNAMDLLTHLERQTPDHRTFMIHAHDTRGAHGIVGKVNVTNVVRGRFCNGTMGYDSYDPYAGRGLFAEGLALIVGLALTPQPRGMGLHRVEANARAGNATSAGVLRRLGFRREGHIPRMLWLESGRDPGQWRDHDSYAITAEEWPSPPYRDHAVPRIAVIVNGLPGSGKSTLAAALARELGLPVWSKDAVKETIFDLLPASLQEATVSRTAGAPLGAGASQLMWRLLADSPVGGIVDNNFRASDLDYARDGLDAAGFDRDRVVQVWCDVPVATARERSMRRRAQGLRHAVHGDLDAEQRMWRTITESDEKPLPLGRIVRVDTTTPVSPRQIAAVALEARATIA